MRRSGRTTRIVDAAVQTLFEKGQITVINSKTDTDGMDKTTLVQDHDEHRGDRQYLFRKIKKRLLLDVHNPNIIEMDSSNFQFKIIKL